MVHDRNVGAPRRARAAAGAALAFLLLLVVAPPRARAQAETPPADEPFYFDFKDAELAVVIEAIAKRTGKNFIYDDRVRGRVTIISPTPVPVDQAYAVFESVLQVKGFTTVETPGGALKVIPVRDAKETGVDTRSGTRPPANRDTYVTRLIPLQHVDAEPVVNTLKPLVSKDAAMVAYVPTNTVILTESASNIRRIMSILDAIDVDTYQEEIAVIKVEYADAEVLGQQITEIYEDTGEEGGAAPRRRRRARTAQASSETGSKPGGVRILTDQRTNSLIVLAARPEIQDVRDLVSRLDVPVVGGGQIHVYYLQHADAEEMAQTLAAVISGQPATPTGGGGAQGGAGGQAAQAIRAAVSGLGSGLTVTADPPTNALVIQATKEGFETIKAVIEQLDIDRPQVLVEALIMEVDVTDNESLGFSGAFAIINSNFRFKLESATEAVTRGALAGLGVPPLTAADIPNIPNPDNTGLFSGFGTGPNDQGTQIQAALQAAAQDNSTNIISAPHILTSDNEEAEIRIGNNIPIITSRVQQPTGATQLSSSVNVERQDIGVTLRVTPQITEGDSLRLDIFQEITAINSALQRDTGDPEEVGVALSNRRIENTVVVADGETVVIGGLIDEAYEDTITKVPWLGDIPILGWAFKSTSRNLRKQNLLVFLTPYIIRSPQDHEFATVRKREEFRVRAGKALEYSEREKKRERERREEAEAAGLPYVPGPSMNPVRMAVLEHEARYPQERMAEIERMQEEERERARAEAEAALHAPQYVIQAPAGRNEEQATRLLVSLIDAGYDGTLVTAPAGPTLLFEIRLGPYETIEEAQRIGSIVKRSHGLVPAILVLPPEDEP